MTARPAGCRASLGPDGQVRCPRCALVWDSDEPDPPECQPKPAKKPKAKKKRKVR